MIYPQVDSSPTGLSYLAGDIMPWEDYVIFRTDDSTSVAIYGQADENGVFSTATVRTVERYTGYAGYSTYETTMEDVSADILYPYYAYGNIIGVNYNLPSSNNITCLICCSAFALTALISVFRLVWSFRKGVAK